MSRQPMKILINLFLILLALLLRLSPDVAAEPAAEPLSGDLYSKTTPAIIVIDPGHGGADEGVKGPDGSLEKTLMLELARKIRARLVPDYDARLTRDDDYQVALTDRTGLANSIHASLMISLHAGAGFTPRSDVTTVYLNSPARPRTLPETESDDAPLPEWQWQHQQDRHQKESQQLGDLLTEKLSAMPRTAKVVTASAHLVVLAGADLPAVLLEFGDLNGAAGEKRLSDPEWQQQCAGAIASAVREFMPFQSQ
ncbi:MAG: N-acetylmuramoyl-L-alanine amidase [Desulfosarcinaceae bacterium]|jgi:N-acetylmuramoyl-L-alanine amidase